MKKQILILAALILSGCSSDEFMPPEPTTSEKLDDCYATNKHLDFKNDNLVAENQALMDRPMFMNDWQETIEAVRECSDLGECLGKEGELRHDGGHPHCWVNGETFHVIEKYTGENEMELALKICRSRR